MGRSLESSDVEDVAAKRRKVVVQRPEVGGKADGDIPSGAARGSSRAANGPAGRILAWLGQGSRRERKSSEAKDSKSSRVARRLDSQSAQATVGAALKAAVARNAKVHNDVPPGMQPTRKRKEAVNALKFGSEVFRSASPCSPEMRPMHRGRGLRRATAAASAAPRPPAIDEEDDSEDCQSSTGSSMGSRASEHSSASSSPVQVRQPAGVSKRSRATSELPLSATAGAAAASSSSSSALAAGALAGAMQRPAAAALAVTAAGLPLRRVSHPAFAAKSAAVPLAARPPATAAATTPAIAAAAFAVAAAAEQAGRRAVISQDDESTFQAAILDRLRSLCGEHEDAQVLAEYIVVMVAGSKGKEEMAFELKPFFQDQAQAESFVDWVEECKWKFLTGGPSPTKSLVGAGSQHPAGVAASSSGARAPARAARSPTVVTGRAGVAAVADDSPGLSAPAAAPHPSARPRLTPNIEFRNDASAAAASIQPGPHVAVTSRVVLQPNPDFAVASSPPSASREGAAAVTKSAAASRSAAGSLATGVSKAAAASKTMSNPVKSSKNELLENMTKQLQLILMKLNDKTLNDEMRERYQALAQNIQMQMAKISRPAPKRRM
mmetsp:Transcript_751/g.1830  ORF Transcript_751/g.1830 Transcript_751/m.1830 type:complete len:608 (+) Transcript_751:80-1903(+)